jgi:hypothetical protein
MRTKWRICHVRKNNVWEVIDLCEIKKGDLFHLFEPSTDTFVKDRQGYIDQFAIEDAIPCPGPDGNCSVVCETSI